MMMKKQANTHKKRPYSTFLFIILTFLARFCRHVVFIIIFVAKIMNNYRETATVAEIKERIYKYVYTK